MGISNRILIGFRNILEVMEHPDCEGNTLDPIAQRMYLHDRTRYMQKAIEWTRKYAI